MRMCINNHLSLLFSSIGTIRGRERSAAYLARDILAFALIICLIACNSPDSTEQRRRELQRDALKLRMGQALNPTDSEGHLQLGKTYYQLGEYENAMECFQNAIALDARNQHAYNNLGLVYLALRLNLQAIDMFHTALEITPANPAFYNNLGYAYDMAEQFDEALSAYRSAIEADATFVDAYYNLASGYLNRESYDEAVEYYEQAIALDDTDATAYFNLGLAYEESAKAQLNGAEVELSKGTSQKFVKAIQAYERGLSLDKTEVEAYYRLAGVYREIGDTLMMRRYLDTFIEQAKGLPNLEEQLNSAKQMMSPGK